jgi:hypothetical protein
MTNPWQRRLTQQHHRSTCHRRMQSQQHHPYQWRWPRCSGAACRP